MAVVILHHRRKHPYDVQHSQCITLKGFHRLGCLYLSEKICKQPWFPLFWEGGKKSLDKCKTHSNYNRLHRWTPLCVQHYNLTSTLENKKCTGIKKINSCRQQAWCQIMFHGFIQVNEVVGIYGVHGYMTERMCWCKEQTSGGILFQ